jgi:hypothetical protein
MKIAIAQPTYLPWLGYFDLIDQVDVFVLLDSVQFEKQSWQQRNRVKTPAGLQWLTVPVRIKGRSAQLIKDVEIAEPDFYIKHLNLVREHYRTAVHFENILAPLSVILKELAQNGNLAAMNIRLIEWFATMLRIRTPLVRSSTLGVQGKRSWLNLAICEALGATEYYSAIGSADYLLQEIGIFRDRGVEVHFHNFQHPEYKQLFPPFCSHASVLDLLLNEGPRSGDVIRQGRATPLRMSELAAPCG